MLYALAISYRAIAIIIGIFILTLLQVYVGSLTGSILSGFYSSISSLNTELFKQVTIKASLIILTSAVIDAILKLFVAGLTWQFRQNLNTNLHPIYFNNQNYYRVQGNIDNSDQRISHDIVEWSSDASIFISKLILAPCTIVYYTILTWTTIDWYAPAIIYGWFLTGYFINSWLIKYLSTLIYHRDSYEGNFRYNHARIRSNAESIVLSQGNQIEFEITTRLFDRVMSMGLSIIKWQFGLNIGTNLFTYLITIINYVIVALPVLFLSTKTFPTESDISGYIAKATFDAISLASGLSLFLNLANIFSDLIGFSNRLNTFITALNLQEEPDFSIQIVPDRIEFRDVTFGPNNIPLVRNLSFVCRPGHNLLIMGPSGSGKTSIQRLISGLWAPLSGIIYRPDNIYHLPAQPYFPRAPLPLQITYPRHAEINDDQIRDLLSRVQLSHLFNNPDAWIENESSIHWTETLSTGERQKLAFARLLYHNPLFAVLDEATSALPVATEIALYQQCQNITMISIGHRPSLEQFHSEIIRLT